MSDFALLFHAVIKQSLSYGGSVVHCTDGPALPFPFAVAKSLQSMMGSYFINVTHLATI
uniref:Uncharacterized protein n=1 Tax=Anguilla anguilla TaxID=7936 RepID=A0A0E9UEX4_ANGAN